MERDYKSLAFTNIKSESSGRIRAGIASVFGNVDNAGDRVMPGAFAKSIAEGAKRCKFLWNHSYQHPPVASILELRELSREELPQEVLDKAPDSTGGLLVKREYYDVELANWILQAIDAGDVNEMSFAYDTLQSSMRIEVSPDNPEKTREVRELLELKLYDTSDVLWGCNFATVAQGNGLKNFEAMPLGVIASQLSLITEQIKAGRRNATADQKLIDIIHASAVDLGAICAPKDTEDGKSRVATISPDEEAGAVPSNTPLSDLKLRAIRFRAGTLTI